jgi:hypothetical protein
METYLAAQKDPLTVVEKADCWVELMAPWLVAKTVDRTAE